MCFALRQAPISMEVRYDLPDFRRRMLAPERRSGDQIFAHCQSADDDRVETNLPDEGRHDLNCVRVVAGDRNPDEFAKPVRVRRQLGFAVAKSASLFIRTNSMIAAPSRRAIGLLTSITSTFFASALP
jgi:hypothetical protein